MTAWVRLLDARQDAGIAGRGPAAGMLDPERLLRHAVGPEIGMNTIPVFLGNQAYLDLMN